MSGLEDVIARVSADGREVEDTTRVTIRIDADLEAMPRSGDDYFFTDQDPDRRPSQRHGNINHFVVAAMADSLVELFADFREDYEATEFAITDISLEWGGLLDVRDTTAGAWRDPHRQHRLGTEADVGDGSIPRRLWQRFETVCHDFGLVCDPEHDLNHFHVRFAAQEG